MTLTVVQFCRITSDKAVLESTIKGCPIWSKRKNIFFSKEETFLRWSTCDICGKRLMARGRARPKAARHTRLWIGRTSLRCLCRRGSLVGHRGETNTFTLPTLQSMYRINRWSGGEEMYVQQTVDNTLQKQDALRHKIYCPFKNQYVHAGDGGFRALNV